MRRIGACANPATLSRSRGDDRRRIAGSSDPRGSPRGWGTAWRHILVRALRRGASGARHARPAAPQCRFTRPARRSPNVTDFPETIRHACGHRGRDAKRRQRVSLTWGSLPAHLPTASVIVPKKKSWGALPMSAPGQTRSAHRRSLRARMEMRPCCLQNSVVSTRKNASRWPRGCRPVRGKCFWTWPDDGSRWRTRRRRSCRPILPSLQHLNDFTDFQSGSNLTHHPAKAMATVTERLAAHRAELASMIRRPVRTKAETFNDGLDARDAEQKVPTSRTNLSSWAWMRPDRG